MRLAVTRVLVATGATLAIALIAQQSVTEAPAGFDMPLNTQNPGSQSVNNGIAEPPGDTFALDQAQFERHHDASTGLGPLFNGTACAECHENGAVGVASQLTEVRVGHRDANGNSVNPTVLINNGATAITGRSIVNDRSICEQAQEHTPATETITTLRAVLNTLGDGFVEAVDDQTLFAIAANQPAQSGGMIHGEAIVIPILEAPGQTGIGRFGWKDQQPTLLSFAGDTYLNEMGVTNRLRPKDVTSVCKITSDPEDRARVDRPSPSKDDRRHLGRVSGRGSAGHQASSDGARRVRQSRRESPRSRSKRPLDCRAAPLPSTFYKSLNRQPIRKLFASRYAGRGDSMHCLASFSLSLFCLMEGKRRALLLHLFFRCTLRLCRDCGKAHQQRRRLRVPERESVRRNDRRSDGSLRAVLS